MSSEANTIFTALCERLERASRALRERGCFLQSIARRYYVIHATATYLAAKFGVVPARNREGERVEDERFSHNELPDVVGVLYTGLRRGGIDPGTHAGIVGAALHKREAERYVDALQRDRKHADYGRIRDVEPYRAAEADRRLRWADDVISDLRLLL